ncbi:MAG: hypothetical protein GY715_10080 [Planctomycetes bacterium]|nr:hypothetical protein [Planctomycetota bacterium]
MASTIPSRPATPADAGVGALAHNALLRVQDAFVDAVGTVPEPTERPYEIAKSLGLHKTLAWKLAKIMESTDPVVIFQRIPGAGAVEKILSAAKRHGVSTERLAAVRTALANLDEIVARHAGDRETFEMILAGLAAENGRDVELLYRRDGFQATSFIWGVQARAMMRAVIVNPNQDGVMLDAAVIFGSVGLRRLRPDRSWVIERWRPTDDLGRPIPVEREAIDDTKAGCAPLLHDFSSTSRTEVQRRILEDGTVEDEVGSGPLGNEGAVTCFTGEVVRSVMPRYRAESNRILAQNLELRTPCRTVVFDHLVPADLYGRVAPQARLYGELAGRPLYTTLRSDRDRLPIHEQVEYLGSGPSVLRTRDVPRYEKMVRHVCGSLGWDADRMDVYRLRMDFPYVPSTITYEYPLPEAPS